MQCPNCSAVAREGAKFCVKCGTALARFCPSCGHGTGSDDLFCAQCGANLETSEPLTATRQTSAVTAPKLTPTAQAERRQITVMFRDMVGSSSERSELFADAKGRIDRNHVYGQRPNNGPSRPWSGAAPGAYGTSGVVGHRVHGERTRTAQATN